MLVCVHCVIIGYWQSWFASTTTTISPMESQEAWPNAHDKKMTNVLRLSTHEHNMHVHDTRSLCPLHLLSNAHWAKLGGLTICICTLCQHEPPIQTCTWTCRWNASTNVNAAYQWWAVHAWYPDTTKFNLAMLHGSVNWHLHCCCEVFQSVLEAYPCMGCTPLGTGMGFLGYGCG